MKGISIKKCNIAPKIVYAMEENKDLNRIKVMLVEKKRTCKWLAEQLGKDRATVSKWCTNTSQPSLEMLLKIADLLEINYTELIRATPKEIKLDEK